MKDLLTNANFPRSADLRVYHLGVRPGEVANRLVTAGTPSRARTIATFLDETPKPFELFSERGFLTITGRYKRTPISIVSIGMGNPNMDFFVREMRECISGDMVIVRLGSCGALENVPVGTVVVPESCVQISRNVDFDFLHPESNDSGPPYRISKLASGDKELCQELLQALERAKPAASKSLIIGERVNASADSFYSSQGRQTSFPDQNAGLIESMRESVPKLATLEMETFHLYHLAACWRAPPVSLHISLAPPLASSPVEPVVSKDSRSGPPLVQPSSVVVGEQSIIRAAAAHMVFASRTSQDFITPQAVEELERWTALGTLDALVRINISTERLHEEAGSVWAIKE
ncbi:nucleoside phosphorylase domain-containing protein [Crepidotus variabilis]|uniref:Nucleoside phosphorylase domain-containing protein n=1 Tax=Crepidotus variabilis TaxID=179855 RepID=A0A9P6JNL6_9AGAR|nr:nucleoside phosphorylase domain-containing protein [Crepidotus variabilis]